MDEKCVRDPRHDCFGLEAAGRLEERVKNLEKWRDDMAEVKNDVKQVLETQRACAQKTSGRWESIKDKVIVGVLTSVLTAGVLTLLVLAVNNL